MNDKQLSTLGLLVAAGMIALLFMLTESVASTAAKDGSAGAYIDALPASGAGLPSALAPAPSPTPAPATAPYLGGTVATGRVAHVYVKVAENVFLDAERAPEHLRSRAERWVDVQFPELLADDTEFARAILNRGEAQVQVGDVVEIKFAHKDNPRYFPVKELTSVTELVASKDQMLAKDYARRILARNGHRAPPPDWLAQASAGPAAPSRMRQTTTADARR